MAEYHKQGEHSEYRAEMESESRARQMMAPTAQGIMVSGSGREHLNWYFCSRTIRQHM